MIRVTKAGKRLKVTVQSPAPLEHVALSLLEQIGNDFCDTGNCHYLQLLHCRSFLAGTKHFSVVSDHKMDSQLSGQLVYEAHFDIKLNHRGALRFQIVNGFSLERAMTVTFIATSSGSKAGHVSKELPPSQPNKKRRRDPSPPPGSNNV